MAQPQNYLALDLEFNQPSGRLIQVGISIANIEQDEKDYLTRSWYLDPQEALSPDIVALTGITDEHLLAHSVSAERCCRELTALIQEHRTFVNPVTWGDGDSEMLKQHFVREGLEFAQFGRRCVDVKTLTSFLAMAHPGSPRSTTGGLASLMGRYKLAFKGLQHRADVDAFNTLRLFLHLVRRQRAFEGVGQALRPWLG